MIIREPVKIVPNREGGIYEALGNRHVFLVNVEQKETYREGKTATEQIKRSVWITDRYGLKNGQQVPGNIMKIYTTDYIEGAEQCKDENNNPLYTYDGEYIYTMMCYTPDIPYLRWGSIDEELCTYE